MTGTCTRCGRERKIRCRGLCFGCYSKQARAKKRGITIDPKRDPNEWFDYSGKAFQVRQHSLAETTSDSSYRDLLSPETRARLEEYERRNQRG